MLLYLATKVLKLPEKRFWTMNPRRLNALARVHAEFNAPPEGSKANTGSSSKPGASSSSHHVRRGYIDQVI